MIKLDVHEEKSKTAKYLHLLNFMGQQQSIYQSCSWSPKKYSSSKQFWHLAYLNHLDNCQAVVSLWSKVMFAYFT